MARTAPATAREKTQQSAVEQNDVRTPSFETTRETGRQESVQDAIASIAYGYWLERKSSNEGSAEEDWLRAEREVLTRQARRG